MPSSLPKPTRIGNYDIVDVIGRGGMGTVFRGTDPRIGRQVAIKMLTAAADDPDLLIRFYREAKYTGSLHHQNIVTVYELGHQEGVPYLVMEFLEGVSLESVIATKRAMSVADKLNIILQVCNGLSYAHKRELVHRDIKPANIMILDDGTAKIVDFGIALLGGSRLTRTGHVVGSLNYMSPEQLSGNQDVDLRTDVYSTAVVLFQMLTGVLPFEGATTAATLKKIMQDPPPPLNTFLADSPDPELEAALNKALAKKREERYPSAEEFALDIARVHQRYEKKMLADLLGHAAESMRRNDFPNARQQVLHVLKVSPQDNEAAALLRRIKQAQEQHQREQQVVQIQMKAEEAIRRNQLDDALHFIEQGMQLDPQSAIFQGLQDAVQHSRAQQAKYQESLNRAREALKAGVLDAAKRAAEEAHQILPEEPEAMTLIAQISARLEKRLRDQRAAEQQKRFALLVNSVEKAMADARMQLYLGQIAEASQILQQIEPEIPQLPPRWREQFDSMKREIEAKQADQNRPTPEPIPERMEIPTAELPAQFDATRFMEREAVASGAQVTEEMQLDAPAEPAALRPSEISHRPGSDLSGDFLLPRQSPAQPDKYEVAPELREFLAPQPSRFSRSRIWLGVAVAVLAVVILWLIVRPKSGESTAKGSEHAFAVGSSYAEINAEPWATVLAVSPASGDASAAIGQATPLRVKLPPGQYEITLQGPNHEQKQVAVNVPQQGGASCFAVFRKPDFSRIVGKD